MCKFKIVGIMVLIAFAVGILLVENAVAAEKFKWCAVWYVTKSESVNVPGEEGRIINVSEAKGILTVLQGSQRMDRMAGVVVYSVDVNTKTGTGFNHGVIEFTDRDGDKTYWSFEGKGEKGIFSGPITSVRETGKFEGLKAKATWSSVFVTPNQFYADWDGEMELPR
jgi:hypothetical protein